MLATASATGPRGQENPNPCSPTLPDVGTGVPIPQEPGGAARTVLQAANQRQHRPPRAAEQAGGGVAKKNPAGRVPASSIHPQPGLPGHPQRPFCTDGAETSSRGHPEPCFVPKDVSSLRPQAMPGVCSRRAASLPPPAPAPAPGACFSSKTHGFIFFPGILITHRPRPSSRENLGCDLSHGQDSQRVPAAHELSRDLPGAAGSAGSPSLDIPKALTTRSAARD